MCVQNYNFTLSVALLIHVVAIQTGCATKHYALITIPQYGYGINGDIAQLYIYRWMGIHHQVYGDLSLWL